MAAAVRHGKLATSQNAQADGTPLRLLSIRPIRRALAATSSSSHVQARAVLITTCKVLLWLVYTSETVFSAQTLAVKC